MEVFVVRIVNDKKYIRWILNPTVASLYRHLDLATVQEVESLGGYITSSWIRLPLTDDPFTWRVYEVNADRTKHWITCANRDYCATTWVRHGGDPDGIYTVSREEMEYYTTGPNVFLQ